MYRLYASTKDVNDAKNFLIEQEIATEDEISLVTQINGYSIDTLNDILYARTGYHDLDAYYHDLDAYYKEEQ